MINEDEIIELVDEEGNEVQFAYEDTLTVDGSEYVVLIPLEENEESEEDEEEYEEVVILKVEKGEDGEDTLITIEDEEEEKKVFDTFYKQREDEFDIED